ncbi:GGDEF domain-containing protein [Shewanella sp. OMA3-2]|uniref:GGDEF domain-containing protein n=1 Tax=Shewanella sp. OMA3-2 TaxID=2908650 RepID=UPI001F2750A5|nr:GGDEF domain-containing protein [Shewanella sp. OMA3-2]UJF20702.1 GGDEF domain-containing protein [Shewanella sp. OMA3-2]
MSITFVMAIFAIISNNLTLSLTLLFSSGVYASAYYLVIWKKHVKLSSYIIIYSLYLLMFYLVYSGGVALTGPLWIFIVPSVSLYIHGLRLGLINIFIFVVISFLIMFWPQSFDSNAVYPIEFKLRLLYSFLTITFLSALYEFSRNELYNNALELNAKLHHLAHFDELTDLHNRRNAQEVLKQHIKNADDSSPFSVLLCDIDYFKLVNDKYGHNVGDKVLVEIAAVFNSNLRDLDYVARWGGEEFLFILDNTNKITAFDVAERIRCAVAQHLFSLEEEDIRITISIGIEEYHSQLTLDQLINHADRYLYEAKKLGRNRSIPVPLN